MLRTSFVLSLFLCLLTAEFIAADNPPTAEDVNTLAELAVLTTNSFYQHTFEVRMRYEFAGSFFSEDDRLALYDSARNSSRQLTDFIASFENIISRIEQYSGEDWERLFGRTGLYEKASGCQHSTILSKFGIDYYAVLADSKNVKPIAEKLLEQIDALKEASDSFYLQLVKGRMLTLLTRNDSNYVPAAEKVFIELSERSDTNHHLALLASIERAKLGLADREIEANRLARDFIDSNLTDDLEVLLPLAFLERRLGLVDAYNELLRSNPKARSVAADITLGWLEAGHNQANPLDAALAAEAALRDDPQKHKDLLVKLAGQNISASPVVDYTAAIVLADINAPDAVYLLLRVCEVLDAESAEVLGLGAEQIAEQAARLAYRVFVKDPNQCGLVTEAFDNYFQLAGRTPDPNLQYVYTQVLTLCGRSQEAVNLLSKIPPSAGRLYSKARLDLLSGVIASSINVSITDKSGYAALFSQYLGETSDCVYVEPATVLLQGYLEDIEILEADRPTYIHTVSDSKKVARFLYDCIQDPDRASILAEFIALDPNSNAEELAEAGGLLVDFQSANKLNVLRAQARLTQRKGDYAAAARMWAYVAERNETVNINSRSRQWWRAKYYQLECAAKAGNNNVEVTHAIDVLLAAYNDVPTDWEEELRSLAQDCGD